LVVAVASEVLFECLAVAFWVVSGSEVEFHVEGFAETTEEVGDELGTSVRGDVEGYSVLGEDIHDKEFGELDRGEGVVCRDEDPLFRQAVDDNEDSIVSSRGRKVFDEVHQDGVPWKVGDRKLFEEAVRLVAMGFSSATSNT
jgi:hypothetical protein